MKRTLADIVKSMHHLFGMSFGGREAEAGELITEANRMGYNLGLTANRRLRPDRRVQNPGVRPSATIYMTDSGQALADLYEVVAELKLRLDNIEEAM